MFKKDNLLVRINLLICTIIIAGFLLTAFLSYRANYTASIDNIEKVSTLASEGIYYQLKTNLSKPIHISLTMSNDDLLKKYLTRENKDEEDQKVTNTIADYLKAYKDQYHYDSVFLVSTLTDRYYNFHGIDRVLSESHDEDVWYYSLLESDEEYSLNIDNDEASQNEITVFVNCKIKNAQGHIMGIIGVGMRLDSLQSLFKSYEDELGVKAYLLDKSGHIEISTQYSGYQKQDFFELMNLESLKNQILNHYEENKVSQYWIDSKTQTNQEDFIVSRYIEDISWHLVIERNNSETLQQLKNHLYVTIAIIISILICILVIVTYVIRGFNKLIEERNIAFRKATERLYDNIYELNITKNCAANASTQRYFESLGAAADLPYNEGLKVIAKKQIQEEYQEGYIQTFCTDNVFKQYELGNRDLRYDFLMTEDGINYYWMRIDALVYYNKQDDCIHMFTYRKNIDKEKRQELEIMKEARIDNLTQLYNRASIQSIIEKKLFNQPHHLHAFFIFDIDHFKKANDLYGHAFGDYVLVEFAKILKENFKSDDIVGRLGGDEFVVFLSIPNLEFIYQKAIQLQQVISHNIEMDGHHMNISASIGISIAPQDGKDFETLYRKADIALYRSKKNGRNTFTIYSLDES